MEVCPETCITLFISVTPIIQQKGEEGGETRPIHLMQKLHQKQTLRSKGKRTYGTVAAREVSPTSHVCAGHLPRAGHGESQGSRP